ncbi:DNA polymerase III subunit gamma/tau [Variovorax sp. RHLX14]|uniref:DNA polymerase III subunit gamma/tau n=1 Tax=Variovorax sp. RHLX14 TaxID=1259731 RepID=UPI003F480268
MSYLVLARKYRPRNFEEMVGQEHVVQALSNALTTQRLHHAYLFTGTRGVGKTTVSRILAKSLNCQGADGQGGITASPCGVCQACVDIDSGRFVDYTELDAASNRGVDEVQSLLEQAVYKPVQGRFKVFMIDEVHMLTNTAFNAMLKTLEEPPEYLKFVLATTDPQKVPVTVLSRCLQFNLRPMAPETVLEHLTQVLAAEHVEAEAQALRLISRAARGSMRDALSLTDQAIAFGNGTLLEGGVRQMLGSADRSQVFALIDALARGDGKTVVETSELLRRDGIGAASTLEEMTSVLQTMAVLQAVPSRVGASGNNGDIDPDAAETERLAMTMPPDETQLLYSLCLHGRGELGLAPDEYAALTMVLLRLLAFKPSSTNAAPTDTRQPGSAEKKTLNEAPAAALAAIGVRSAPVIAPPAQRLVVRETAAPAPATSPAPAPVALAASPAPEASAGQMLAMPVRVQPPAGARALSAVNVVANPEMPPSEHGDFWHATVTQLIVAETITALCRELALQSQLVTRELDQWLLRVERETLNQPASRDKLQAALAVLGHEVRITIEVGEPGGVSDSPARRNKLAADARQRAAEEAIHADPDVQSMMRDWDAKIVPGTLRPT